MLTIATEVGLLDDSQIGNSQFGSVLISNLPFADDTLIFCKPDESNLGYLRCALLLFEAMPGFKVNLPKNVLFSIGEVPKLHHLAHFFGYGLHYLPSSCLGLPLGANFQSKVVRNLLLKGFTRDWRGGDFVEEHFVKPPYLFHVLDYYPSQHH